MLVPALSIIVYWCIFREFCVLYNMFCIYVQRAFNLVSTGAIKISGSQPSFPGISFISPAYDGGIIIILLEHYYHNIVCIKKEVNGMQQDLNLTVNLN